MTGIVDGWPRKLVETVHKTFEFPYSAASAHVSRFSFFYRVPFTFLPNPSVTGYGIDQEFCDSTNAVNGAADERELDRKRRVLYATDVNQRVEKSRYAADRLGT